VIDLRFFKQIAIALLALALIAGCSAVTPRPTTLPAASLTVGSSETATQPPTPISTAPPSSTPLPTAYTGLVPKEALFRFSKGPIRLVDASLNVLLVGSAIIVCGYQPANGKQDWCRTTGEAPNSLLRSLNASPDGNTYLTGLENGMALGWDTSSGKQLWALSGVVLNAVAWSPDSQQLVYSTRDLSLHILQTRDGTPVASIPLVGIPPDVLSWSPDGKMIAAGDNSGQVVVYDAQTRQAIMGHSFFPAEYFVSSLAWSTNSLHLVAGATITSSCTQNCIPTYSGRLAMVDAHSGGLIWQVDAGNQVHSLALSPDGQTLLAKIGEKAFKLYSVADGTVSQSISADPSLRTAWLPDGQAIYAVDQSANLLTWNLAGVQQASIHLDGYDTLTNFAWSRDGARLAASTTAGQVLIWDVSNGTLLKSFPARSTDGPLDWSPDGQQIATLQGQNVTFWNLSTGRQEKVLAGAGRFSTGQGWSPDGSRFSTFDAYNLTIWDTSQWTVSMQMVLQKPVYRTDEPHVPVNLTSIAWSPDGKYLAGVGGIDVWNVANGEKTEIEKSSSTSPYQSLGWFQDSTHVWIGGIDFGITIIAYSESGFTTSYIRIYGFTCSAVSPDGKYLATAGDQIVLRSPKDGSLLQGLNGAADQPDHLVFSPDSKMLASLSKADGTIILWKVP